MIVTIHQPDFLPWLGFFERWLKSDVYIALDDVQFLRRGWHHRDKIISRDGSLWLTVPVLKKGNYFRKINEVVIDNKQNWRKKHLNSIYHSYRKAPNLEYIFGTIEEIYGRNHSMLIDLNFDLLKFCAAQLGIKTQLKMASDFGVKTKGTQRLIDLVKSVGGTTYLTGTGSKAYLDEDLFREHEIELRWQEFRHPIYQQLNSGFVENLSGLDYLMMA